jgi:hypothetical protein
VKRFTETGKWSDPWFRKLGPVEKVVFMYLLDNCNNAGFWEVDTDALAFLIGITPLEAEGAIKGLSRGVIRAGGWVWLKNFLRHQKNDTLNPENPMHKQIIGLLNEQVERFSDCPEFLIFAGPLNGAIKGLKSPTVTVDGKGDGKGQRKGSAEGKEIPDTLVLQEGFEREWSEFKVMRQKIKKPLTLRGEELILATLAQQPARAVAGLQMAISKCWQGFDWEWFDNATRSNRAGPLDKSKTVALREGEMANVFDPETGESVPWEEYAARSTK